MNENFSESVKSVLEAAQQQAVMNYHQEYRNHSLLQRNPLVYEPHNNHQYHLHTFP